MSENNLWGEENEGDFLDRPDETNLDASGQQMHAPPVSAIPQRPIMPSTPPRPVIAPSLYQKEEEEDLSELDLFPDGDPDEEDFSEVLNDANLRIEQGRLYQMIMNHDLFESMDANPKAVKNVEKEIRKFARERMEIMLGMRKEVSQVEHLEIDFPFNAIEVEVLKKLAFTATKGASENSDRYVPEVRRTTEEVEYAPRRQTLKPIGGSTGFKSTPTKTPAPQKKPLTQKPAAPIKRRKLDASVEQILAEEGVPRELIEENYVPIGKPLHELSAEELAQRQKETMERLRSRRTVKSSSAIPMATPEQQEMLALTRAVQMKSVEGMDGLRIPGGMAALLDKVNRMPMNNPE